MRHQTRPSRFFFLYKCAQLIVRHGFTDKSILIEVDGLHVENRVHRQACLHLFHSIYYTTSRIIVKCPYLFFIIESDALGGNLLFQILLIEHFESKIVTCLGGSVPTLHKNITVSGILDMEIGGLHGLPPHVLILELVKPGVGAGHDEVCQNQRNQHNDDGTHKIGQQKPPETDSVAQNRDNLIVGGEFRSEPYHADKREQGDEKIDEVWDEIEIISRDNLLDRNIPVHETLDILRQIEDDDDGHQQRHGIDHRPEEFLQDVGIEDFPSRQLPKSFNPA